MSNVNSGDQNESSHADTERGGQVNNAAGKREMWLFRVAAAVFSGWLLYLVWVAMKVISQ
jgi:cytoskeletal protein RodZ